MQARLLSTLLVLTGGPPAGPGRSARCSAPPGPPWVPSWKNTFHLNRSAHILAILPVWLGCRLPRHLAPIPSPQRATPCPPARPALCLPLLSPVAPQTLRLALSSPSGEAAGSGGGLHVLKLACLTV